MRRLFATALVSLLLAFAVASATKAVAHEGDGRLTLMSADEIGTGSVRYEVELTFDNDAHPANDATVTVVATLSASAQGSDKIGPVQMAHTSDGRYQAAVEFPKAGEWTLRFTAVDPSASLEQTQAVSEAASTSESGSSESGSSESGTEESSGVSRLVVTGVAIAVGVVLLAGVVFVAIRQKRSGDAHDTETVK